MDNMDSILTKLLISTKQEKNDKRDKKEREWEAKIMESIRQLYRPTKIK